MARILLLAPVAFLTLGPVASAATLRVRNTEITTPFEVRILVNKHSEAQGALEISGTELMVRSMASPDSKPLPVPGESLRCEYKRDSATSKKSAAATLVHGAFYWVCRSGKFSVAITDATRIQPVAGFLKVGKQFLRQAVELVPRHEQLWVINDLDVDAYLAGLVNKEIRSDWPEEAIKAQVIAARSYALAQAADRRRAGEVYDLLSTQADQVYDGAEPEDARSYRLVKATGNQVLMHRERVLKAYYHAANGGYMESPENVWGRDVNDFDRFAYRAGPSPVDETLSQARWRLEVNSSIGKAWKGVGPLEDMRVHALSDGRRVRSVIVQGRDTVAQIWTASELRQRLGGDFLKSNYFKIREREDKRGWVIEGSGWGHGVGLSQLGAQALAKQGKKANDILSYYYPFASIRELPLGGAPTTMAPSKAR